MKIQSLLIAAVAIIVGLSACNKEDTFAQQEGIPANAVQITASIGNPFAATRSNPIGTVEEQGKFNEGDKIHVKDFIGGEAVYQFDGTNWMPIDNKYLLWADDVVSFGASYNIGGMASDNSYGSVQKDQSTLPLLSLSDYMTGDINNAQKGDVINFTMLRQTYRNIVKIAKFSQEFSDDSKVTDVKFNTQRYNGEFAFEYTPYRQGEGYVNSTYTLLLGKNESAEWMYISLKVGDKELRTAAFEVHDNIKGVSYTYNLIVGKEKLEIASVTVDDWTTGETIPGGHAGEDKFD